MRQYKCLNNVEWSKGSYKLTSLRDEDKYQILKWRNEQIDILRQKTLLTKDDQETYFKNVVGELFLKDKPGQILFSFFYENIFIGYGGLVHIDWESKNAEISFLIDTKRDNETELFIYDFKNYLQLLIDIGFNELKFIKLHTTVYDIPQRATYINTIKEIGFVEEAKLQKHILINGQLTNVFIYSYFKN